MCQYEKCTGSYGEAYRGCESVFFEVSLLCPKCAHQIQDSTHIHFGGEQWQPTIKCPNCEWSVFLTVKPKTMFLSRKGPVPAEAEPEKPKSIDEATAEYNERRIWWQNELDRQVALMGGWEPLQIWHGIHIGDLSPERKRAFAAGIEHALEEARAPKDTEGK